MANFTQEQIQGFWDQVKNLAPHERNMAIYNEAKKHGMDAGQIAGALSQFSPDFSAANINNWVADQGLAPLGAAAPVDGGGAALGSGAGTTAPTQYMDDRYWVHRDLGTVVGGAAPEGGWSQSAEDFGRPSFSTAEEAQQFIDSASNVQGGQYTPSQVSDYWAQVNSLHPTERNQEIYNFARDNGLSVDQVAGYLEQIDPSFSAEGINQWISDQGLPGLNAGGVGGGDGGGAGGGAGTGIPTYGLGGAAGSLGAANTAISNAVTAGQDFMAQGNIGAEDAMMQALTGARGDLAAGMDYSQGAIADALNQSRGDVLSGGRQAVGAFTRGMETGRGDIRSALGQGRQDITSALGQGRGDLAGGTQSALSSIARGLSGYQDQMSPWAQSGMSAHDRQAALAGAMGPQAQAQAFAEYQSSPGQQWAVDRGLKAIEQSAAAKGGGFGGGNVMKSLADYAIGRAQQNYQQDFENLGGLANKGFQASSGLGQAAMGAGQASAGIQQQGSRDMANLAQQAGTNLANMGMTAGGNMANLAQSGWGNVGNLHANQGNTLANLSTGAGTNLANIGMTGAGGMSDAALGVGSGIANLRSGLGTNLANIGMTGASGISGNLGRLGGYQYDTGQQIGTNLSNTAVGMGNLANQLGTGIAGDLSGYGANMGNFFTGAGQQGGQVPGNLMTMYGNLATGQGTATTPYISNSGVFGALGTAGQWGGLFDALRGMGMGGAQQPQVQPAK